MVHITGSGFWGNIPRIVHRGYSARIELGSWPIPPIFPLIQRLGNIEQDEMFLTFNMGIGMMMVVSPWYADAVMHKLKRAGEKAYLIGEIRKGGKRVQLG
jgi:phosphoribosylformylglycinamidine cyclo-ligase